MRPDFVLSLSGVTGRVRREVPPGVERASVPALRLESMDLPLLPVEWAPHGPEART